MIAGAVTASMADQNWDDIIDFALRANDAGFKLGAPTWAAKTHDRLQLGIEIAHKYNGDSVFSHDGKAFHASVLLHLQ